MFSDEKIADIQTRSGRTNLFVPDSKLCFIDGSTALLEVDAQYFGDEYALINTHNDGHLERYFVPQDNLQDL